MGKAADADGPCPWGAPGAGRQQASASLTERTPAAGPALRGAGQGCTGVLTLPGQRDGVVGKWQQASFRRDSAQEATLNEPHLLQVHFHLFLRPRRMHSDLMLSDLGLDVRGVRLASPLPAPLPGTRCHQYVLNDWLPALACSMFLHSLAIMECSGCGDHVHPNPFLRGAQGSCGKGLSLLAGVQTFTHLCVRLRTCSGKGLERIPRKVSQEGGWQCRMRWAHRPWVSTPSRHEGPRVSRRGGVICLKEVTLQQRPPRQGSHRAGDMREARHGVPRAPAGAS
ncbi:LOW QUALITY PROTEIN: uncharacterized protein LOC104681120 [Rhinopithecus roxellana]|uniref:LOW QUALITY PROTEIN: uncharacterized protein LOC104681120 n=1 Tax=Rhinopithecus roxellana TaxID=61622 RepID=UPI00053349D6|nr:LOW QUALITY PROTEIN: uncharacterized protein LOC104681120 [Rhinopithecus roxellana]